MEKKAQIGGCFPFGSVKVAKNGAKKTGILEKPECPFRKICVCRIDYKLLASIKIETNFDCPGLRSGVGTRKFEPFCSLFGATSALGICQS